MPRRSSSTSRKTPPPARPGVSAGAEDAAGLRIAGTIVEPGGRARLEIPLARLPATGVMMSMPVEIVRGTRPGPCVWVSGTIHGDELNGIEIVRQVRRRLSPDVLAGTVLAVPIVNVFGFMRQSRYLPDRRDLNRSFPGSSRGSLAARIAHVFMDQIVAPCSHGIDLHTGSDDRRNLPQVRANLDDAETRRCAIAFGSPVIIDATTRDGSLRAAAARLGKHVLLFEAGEPHRFNRDAVQAGVLGVLRVLACLGMLEPGPGDEPASAPVIATSTQWVRSRASGLLRLNTRLGSRVQAGEELGFVSDAFGEINHPVMAPASGIVIGRAGNPLVHRGDALVHIATEFEERRRGRRGR